MTDHACKEWLRAHPESAADLLVCVVILAYALLAAIYLALT